MNLQAFQTSIQEAQSAWRGCVWPTEFGPLKLNLCGLRSRQAALAANALRGAERRCWQEAACWLSRVERDADRAAALASLAVQSFNSGNLDLAQRLLAQAARIECQYRTESFYARCRPLAESSSGRGTTN
ncbi:hypothetical protein FYK55_16315 [Roseiconus nitratireducens]|uniref:Uncharacterized protein n=1 Tax=Roseiconus nitratireducens TaxID=2605748 RepID=A0A5M6D9A8_9BACT|nr:hypothetical protein [Roseiconus nitratireducens]KAA5541775.1 hypothetical protein FYK55_16315 [Roseiconus nitratireducens]